MLVGADRCLGDIVSEMLSTIEDTEESHEEAHIYLCTLFPQFAHIFSEIKEVRGDTRGHDARGRPDNDACACLAA